MLKNIMFYGLGLIVGLSVIAGSWAIVMGLCWLVFVVFQFVFALIPYSKPVVTWLAVSVFAIPILLISQVVGTNIVGKYIRVKQG